MKNIKVIMSPPYRPDQEAFKSKVEMTIEFDDETKALNFIRDLNMLIIEFNDKD